jgi:general secretion pathway protein F
VAGRLASEGWPWLLGGAAALWAGATLALRAPRVRARWAAFWLRVPGVGGLIARLESARLCRLMGELTRNGVALPAVLRLTRDAAPNAAFRAELERVAPAVEAGRGLSAPLSEGGVVAPLALQLIRVGEESGRLAPMLERAADILEADARAALDRLLSLLTPALTLLMGGVIALIVSSILSALLQINELTL